MNNYLQTNVQLLFRHEVLRARLDIRDFFLKNAVKEVYENIGQVLSLVRLQLAMLDADKRPVIESIATPDNLVGQSIRDLRVMCKSFYPDADILSDEGFTESLRDTLKILYQNNEAAVAVDGNPKEIQPELKLVVFKMIQEVLILIKEMAATLVNLVIAYAEQEVKITITYKGEAISLSDNVINNDSNLTLQERAQLIDGKWSLTKQKNGLIELQLTHPLNCSYE